ncbi:MAG: zinc dependent phospholipase C family protein [Ginsengibacter sp.]
MKSKILKTSIIFLLITCGFSLAFAWGSWGHKHISRAAIFALPDSMQRFYYNHIDFITESAVVPDLRKYMINDKAEGPRHYIDIEDFGKIPPGGLPRTTKEAYTKYDSAFLFKTGYLPWYIQNMTAKLTEAFKKKNKSEILFASAELSHYVADAHMPLHTSSNHDGQKTGQKGIHALWESIIPPMFGDSYNFKVAPARYITDVPGETWKIINQSHSLVDTLLKIERSVRNTFTADNMYKKDEKGEVVKFFNSPVFSNEYAAKFNQAMGGMVEQQLRLSIQEVADFWYTAWVDGGSPDLLSMDDPHLTKQNRRNFRREAKAWNKGKILNLNFDRENQ